MSCEISISLASLMQDKRRCVFDFLSASTVWDASGYCSFAYSALASFRMGMSGRSLRQSHPAQQVGEARVGAQIVPVLGRV